MIRYPVELIAALFAAGALLVVWVGGRDHPESSFAARVVPDHSGLERKVALLLEGLAQLENTLSEGVDPPPLQEPTAASQAPTKEDERIAERIGVLELRVEGLQDEFDEWVAATTVGRPYSDDSDDWAETRLATEALGGFQQQILDANAGVHSKVVALEMLKEFPEGMAALDPVMEDIGVLLLSTESERELEQLINEVDGIADERLLGPLLYLLQDHPSDEIQFEVLHALRQFMDHPDVLSALEVAAAGPPGRSSRRAENMLKVLLSSDR